MLPVQNVQDLKVIPKLSDSPCSYLLNDGRPQIDASLLQYSNAWADIPGTLERCFKIGVKTDVTGVTGKNSKVLFLKSFQSYVNL